MPCTPQNIRVPRSTVAGAELMHCAPPYGQKNTVRYGMFPDGTEEKTPGLEEGAAQKVLKGNACGVLRAGGLGRYARLRRMLIPFRNVGAMQNLRVDNIFAGFEKKAPWRYPIYLGQDAASPGPAAAAFRTQDFFAP